jgi:ABC-type phosphate transport system substrate-binding protein
MMENERRPTLAATALAAALLLAGCGDGRSLPGEESTAADSAISGGLTGPGLSGTLDICAADGLGPVARRQAAAFMRQYDSARISVATATARECVASVASLAHDAAMIDRPLNDEERQILRGNQIPFSEVAIGTGALAAIVADGNGARTLRLDALRRLLRGEVVDWAELADSAAGPPPAGAAQLALAPRNAGAVEVLTERMLAPGELPRPAHPADNETGVIDWVATTPGALGVVSLAVLRADTTGRVRAVALPDSTGRPALPVQQTLADGRYPLPQPVVMVVVGGRGPLPASYATFARGNPGQEAVLRAGMLPAVRPVREIVLD